MIHFFIFFGLSFFAHAAENSKIEYPGCPENSFCQKETGIHRTEWMDILTKFEQNKINEKEANRLIQSKTGMPISMWATEEALKKPLTILWESPCKQHKIPTNKTYVAITFLKELIQKNNILFHSPAILLDENKSPRAIMVPRGDAPLYIINDSLYYTQEEEGHFYGLLISPQGRFILTKTFSDSHYPKETSCTKDQIELFNRMAPSPNFFQGYYCKEIWNTKTKSYQSILLGWSCN